MPDSRPLVTLLFKPDRVVGGIKHGLNTIPVCVPGSESPFVLEGSLAPSRRLADQHKARHTTLDLFEYPM